MSSEIEIKISPFLINYLDAIDFMEERVALIRSGDACECVWLLQHPSLYTAGTSANPKDLLETQRFPIYQTGRGGQYTYHGPGQLVVYVMIDIQKRGLGIREYIQFLEKTIIDTLYHFQIPTQTREGRVGVWYCDGNIEEKIAAIGVRVRRGVTYHGLAINISPQLSHFSGIVPCGISAYGVTSVEKIDSSIEFNNVQEKIIEHFLLNLSII